MSDSPFQQGVPQEVPQKQMQVPQVKPQYQVPVELITLPSQRTSVSSR